MNNQRFQDPFVAVVVSHVFFAILTLDEIGRLILIVPSLLAKSTLAHSGRTPQTTVLLTYLNPNISQYP